MHSSSEDSILALSAYGSCVLYSNLPCLFDEQPRRIPVLSTMVSQAIATSNGHLYRRYTHEASGQLTNGRVIAQ
eukprot:scaffold13589_cov179-Alexandrium_tamarense.AAC.3